MSFIYFSIILLYLRVVICYGDESDDTPALKYLTEHLDRYCSLSRNRPVHECRNEISDSERCVVKQGKAGPRGPPGPPSTIDYDEMDKRIKQKLAGKCLVRDVISSEQVIVDCFHPASPDADSRFFYV